MFLQVLDLNIINSTAFSNGTSILEYLINSYQNKLNIMPVNASNYTE